jgi:D-alanyl-D-alanine dipeptidase
VVLGTYQGDDPAVALSGIATPEESNDACYMDAPGLGSAARENRAILREALSVVGMVNYPTEWWHGSCGDRYWALSTGAERAIYVPTGP